MTSVYINLTNRQLHIRLHCTELFAVISGAFGSSADSHYEKFTFSTNKSYSTEHSKN